MLCVVVVVDFLYTSKEMYFSFDMVIDRKLILFSFFFYSAFRGGNYVAEYIKYVIYVCCVFIVYCEIVVHVTEISNYIVF